MIPPPVANQETERLAALYALNLLDTEPEERFNRVTEIASALFSVPIAYISLVDENRQWYKACFGMPTGETTREVSFCGYAILNDEALVIPDATDDERFHDNPLVTGDPHIRFYAGLPLKCPEGYNVGTLCLVDQSPRNLDDDAKLLLGHLGKVLEREIASSTIAQLHSEISELRTKEQDYLKAIQDTMAIGRRIQTNFLPKEPPRVDGWTLGAAFKPAMEVAGDFYDFIDINDEKMAIAIGDISGKGVGAAIFMSTVRTLLRSAVERSAVDGLDEMDAVSQVNNYIATHHRAGGHMFASLFFCVLDKRTGVGKYVNAGHCPPIVKRSDSSFERLNPTGPAVGLMHGCSFKIEAIDLEPGAQLIGFTDGLDECRDESGEEYGDERVVETVMNSKQTGDALADSICTTFEEFTAGAAVQDDLTLIVVSRNA